jgi:predicted transporter
VRDAHLVTAWLLIGANAFAGAWCLLAHQHVRFRGRSLWAVVIVAQVLAFVQAVFGALLSRQDGVVLDDMHALYGFSAIVAAMILYAYRTSPFMRGKEHLLYGAGSLFIMGLGLRELVLHG